MGLTHGGKNGLKRPTPILKQMLSKTTVWFYKDQHTSFYCVVTPQQSFANLVVLLQKITPKCHLRVSSFYKIIHGTRKQMYGWRLKKIVLSL
jgi:hypothetical protein